MIGSHRFPMYRPVDGKIDVDYLISYLMTKRGKDILEAASPGGAGRNRTLGQDRFMNSKIVLPTPAEQKKIAEILTTQDKVIELKEKLLAEKQRQKKYLMQQLLTEKKRLTGFDGEWKRNKLGDLFAERTETKCEHLELFYWKWTWDRRYDGKYDIENLHPVCSKCDTPLTNSDISYGKLKCLRCNEEYWQHLPSEQNIKLMITDNVRRKYFPNE